MTARETCSYQLPPESHETDQVKEAPSFKSQMEGYKKRREKSMKSILQPSKEKGPFKATQNSTIQILLAKTIHERFHLK